MKSRPFALNHSLVQRLLLGVWLSLLGASAYGTEADDIATLRAQVQQLEQQLKILSRKLELQEEKAAAKPVGSKAIASDKAVSIASDDNANYLRIGGLFQADSRLFFNDGGGIPNNQFVLRRARITAQGQFAKNFGFVFTPDFAGSAVTILDAALTVKLSDALQFKLGKFKTPVGLELLQSDAATFFSERSLATNLVPNRDVGFQASGDLAGGKISYQAGIFGGVADASSTSNADVDNDKDLAARVTTTPFKGDKDSPLAGLTLGIGGTLGRQKTTAGRTGGYKTGGQQTFFSYNATTTADGDVWRISPQVDYRSGAFGAMGEYVMSTVNLRPSASAPKTEVRNHGWHLGVGYVLTGEDSSFAGIVPHDNFDWASGTWGAFEVVGRFSNVAIDDRAFPLLASVGSNASEATEIGGGLNWYLSKAVTFRFDYFHTAFRFGPGAPATPTPQFLRQDENVFISRFQLAF